MTQSLSTINKLRRQGLSEYSRIYGTGTNPNPRLHISGKGLSSRQYSFKIFAACFSSLQQQWQQQSLTKVWARQDFYLKWEFNILSSSSARRHHKKLTIKNMLFEPIVGTLVRNEPSHDRIIVIQGATYNNISLVYFKSNHSIVMKY